jgi:glycosyltransferase involved in cell wall biosynthesis
VQWAVESVELQDYPADRYELILIDDGSTHEDVTPYLDLLQPRFDARGWTIVRSTNMYLGAARNKAVTFSKYLPTFLPRVDG